MVFAGSLSQSVLGPGMGVLSLTKLVMTLKPVLPERSLGVYAFKTGVPVGTGTGMVEVSEVAVPVGAGAPGPGRYGCVCVLNAVRNALYSAIVGNAKAAPLGVRISTKPSFVWCTIVSELKV